MDTQTVQAGVAPQATWSEKQTKPLRELPQVAIDQAMARLWRRMAAIYGEGRWLTHAPEDVRGDWSEILRAQSLADLVRGIERYERTPGRFPPGAAEFRDSCREWQPGTFSGASAPPSNTPALVHMARRSKVGRQWMAFMWYEGIVAKPAHVTMDLLDEWLLEANIEQMRQQCSEGVERLRRRMGA